MNLRDLLNPNLAAEPELRAPEPSQPELRSIFFNEMYEVFLGLYPGGLLSTLVHYRKDELRIMSRLGRLGHPDFTRESWVHTGLELLRASGRGPFHLIRDSKMQCGILLSLHDRAALKLAGVDIPRSAGRYKDLFANSSESRNS